MDPRETLARLTTHGPSLDGGARGTALDRLTAADVGFALGMGLGKGEARVLLAKYCDDRQEQRMLQAEFFAWMMDQAKEWARPRPGMVYGLSYAVSSEFLGTNRCPVCHGVAEVQAGALRVSCDPCGGTGMRYPSEQDFADAIGCTIAAYRHMWASRVAMGRRELDRLEYAAVTRFAEVMGHE